ncbi:hypothetical protein SAMN04488057_11764 [Cyclobacterium lianum]|uniref:Outer membrane protein beta-barrel domain-containing protein n=1 Tax=Cyclobacterium lianum TaxID=388280 RepID=A0A1M7QF61_9BACT|nr:hypothetical protein [Cyclobacterium lianum]SHN29556.1 hypothetical protein SAMN04488057_11764 [Cyclobacterium lianum]
MKKQTNIYLIVLLTGFFSYQSLSAQNFYKEKISRNQYFQAGLGLGAMYADNSGRFRGLEVKTGPSVSFAYGRKIHSNIDLRTNLGYQRTQSQDQNYFSDQVVASWRGSGEAIGSKNNMIYLDVMPTLHIVGSENHTQRKRVNLYIGTGIGMLLNFNETTTIDANGSETNNRSHVVGYIPVRGGLSYRLNLYTDIALEGSILITFSDELDGNVGFNRFNDYPVSGQVVFRRYLNPIRGME